MFTVNIKDMNSEEVAVAAHASYTMDDLRRMFEFCSYKARGPIHGVSLDLCNFGLIGITQTVVVDSMQQYNEHITPGSELHSRKLMMLHPMKEANEVHGMNVVGDYPNYEDTKAQWQAK